MNIGYPYVLLYSYGFKILEKPCPVACDCRDPLVWDIKDRKSPAQRQAWKFATVPSKREDPKEVTDQSEENISIFCDKPNKMQDWPKVVDIVKVGIWQKAD